MKTAYRYFSVLSIAMTLVFAACHKEKPPVPEPVANEHGHIIFSFVHKVDGQNAIYDSMMYVNAAGNPYLVTDVQYFISDITLHKSDGSNKMITSKSIYYIDTKIPSTLSWSVADEIPIGSYNSISFTFGIDSAKNVSYIFPNPPESNMEWPIPLGGGYHMMKLNGKYKDLSNIEQNFNAHIGIGMDTTGGNTSFVQNYFSTTLPSSSFTIAKDDIRQIPIIMNIDSWFKTPTNFDFNVYGQNIMQNQTAMHIIVQNGFDVFTTGTILKKEK